LSGLTKVRCLALFSGGLDSQLAVRLIQRQGADVSAVHFRSPWSESTAQTRAAAAALSLPLVVLDLSDRYVERLRQPRFGYLAGAAACLDCRIAMLTAARDYLEAEGADFIVTGDVVGQRIRTSIRDLELVAHHACLHDRLLRPLSARLLEPVLAERQGRVDRSQLLGWQGKSRRPQERLAADTGLTILPPRPDCPLLAEPLAARAWKLVRSPSAPESWELALLAVGRQLELDGARVILGRDRDENDRLALAARRSPAMNVALISPANFFGPMALLIGNTGEANVQHAAALVARYSRSVPKGPLFRVEWAGDVRQFSLTGAT
jgi:tRNA-specific 2-thiouridylase